MRNLGKLKFPVVIEHAAGNESPDFMIGLGRSRLHGYEVTQATTKKYQKQSKRAEEKSEGAIPMYGGRGWTPKLAGTYWRRRILKSVRAKLQKLSGCETAASQNLVIYDDMDVMVADHNEAVALLAPRLSKLLSELSPKFDTISIVTTGGLLLLDVSGHFESVPILRNKRAM